MMDKIHIVSGGQTGVDRAALDVALKNNISCGGYCPKGRIAEDGVIPEHYPLTETESPEPEEVKISVRVVASSKHVFTDFPRETDLKNSETKYSPSRMPSSSRGPLYEDSCLAALVMITRWFPERLSMNEPERQKPKMMPQ